MSKIYMRDGRRGSMLWIMVVLIMIGMSTQVVHGVECPECQEPNTDYDPDNPYETDKPCIECCENDPCDAGQGCGCCVDGDCWAPTPDCKDPMDVKLRFVRIGDCPCEDDELGCVDPGVTANASAGACFDNCAWKPAPPDLTVYYREGLCPDRCQSSVSSTSNVNEDNYCDVLKALEDRIEQEELWTVTPPPPPPPGDPPKPPEPVCFTECIQDHEDQHVEQMKELWNSFADEIRDALGEISTPFDCDIARTPEDASKEMKQQVDLALANIGSNFAKDWDKDMEDNDKAAYQASLQCLNDLLADIQALALADCP